MPPRILLRSARKETRTRSNLASASWVIGMAAFCQARSSFADVIGEDVGLASDDHDFERSATAK